MSESPEHAFDRGLDLFDAGEFFEAHETWERLWRVEADAACRQLLQGLIQAAAAFHKMIVMKSPDAAERLLARALAKLDACPPHLWKLDVGPFCVGLRACAKAIASGTFDRASIPRLAYESSQ